MKQILKSMNKIIYISVVFRARKKINIEKENLE